MFTRLAYFAHDNKYLVVLFWFLALFLIVSTAPSLDELTSSQSEGFIPDTVESIKVRNVVSDKFTKIGESSGIIIFEKDQSFTSKDLSIIRGVNDWIDNHEEELSVTAISSGLDLDGLVSDDHKALLMVVWFVGDQQEPAVIEGVTKIQEKINSLLAEDGMRSYMIGGAAIGKDMDKQFATSQTRSETATMLLVLVTLMIVYRAIPAMFFPLIVIMTSVVMTTGIVALLVTNVGLRVSQMTPMFIILVLLGAGTNYCLFLISRYKEELIRGKDVRTAIRVSMVNSGEAIASSAFTVIIGFTGMVFAEMTMFRTSGPAIAIGITVTLAAALTLLPAILAIFGTRFFWPSKIVKQSGSGEMKKNRLWHAVGYLVVNKPFWLLTIGTAVLIPTAFLASQLAVTTDMTKLVLPPDSQSMKAIDTMDRHFSRGESSKITVLVEDSNLDEGRKLSAINTLSKKMEALPKVDTVDSIASLPSDPRSDEAAALTADIREALASNPGSPETLQAKFAKLLEDARNQFISEDGTAARLEVTVTIDPLSDEAAGFVKELRREIPKYVQGTVIEDANIYVGGGPAESLDLLEVVERDFLPISGIVIFGIFIVLVGLLRSLVAPVYLILTVILTFYTALGATYLLFDVILHAGKTDPSLEIFTFVFIVALGEDFNIFLMSRMKEEIAVHGHKEGIFRSVALTGGVISSAGLIMAGAIGSFALSPMMTLMQMGFAISFGILLDTFVVRPIIVPSIAYYLGDLNWWPWGHPKIYEDR